MMKTQTLTAFTTIGLLGGVLLAALPPQPVLAAGPGSLAGDLPSSSLFMPESQPTLAPFAHVKFCMTAPDQCLQRKGARIIDITNEVEKKIKSINVAVNQAIKPRMDPPGQEDWHVESAAGSCHDYAVTKRKRLIDSGFSPMAVRLAVARTAYGEGHAVVVIRTSKGDVVLDNRTDQLKLWNQTDLQWVKIESSENPRLWFTL